MIEADVRTALIAAAAVTALVGTRIAAGVMPEGELRPYVTYQLISAQRPGSMSAHGTLRNARVQFNCWSQSYSEAKQIAQAVQDAIEASPLFDVVFNGDLDLYDDATDCYYVAVDYSVWQDTV
jgi:hypothetical protein